MRIRRYRAKSLREAFDLIRADLGSEAVIISTRNVAAGVEVSAAVDYDAPLEGAAAQAAGGGPKAGGGPSGGLEGALRDIRLDLSAMRQIVLGANLLREEAPGSAALFGWLAGRGLSSEIALEIIAALGPEERRVVPPRGRGLANLARAVGRMVPVGGFLQGEGRRVVALVGPTGVGKTTTVAKLAARLAVKERRRVGIVSCDSYRVGAPDQIRSYARVLGVPLGFCASERELAGCLAAQAEQEVVLVDTPGHSPADAERLSELAALAEAGVESHLVLSATTRDEELAAAIRGFSPAQFRSVIFTKLDEAQWLGGILNAARRAQRPISWLGTGQRVPGDMEPATPEKVARLVLQIN
jgi:flagellar biosynthesis protein FlhF